MLKYDHLLGMEFVDGSRDCYEIGRDFFRENFGIELRPYARPHAWWEAEQAGLNLYQNHFHDEGFRVIDIPLRDLWEGDVFLMAIGSSVPCHAGIYVGEGKMLHHYYGRRSEVTLYKGLWRNATTAILRHHSIKVANTSVDTVNLMDLLPAHLRKKLEDALPAGQAGRA